MSVKEDAMLLQSGENLMQKSLGGELAAFQVTSHYSKIFEGVFKKQSQSASHIVLPDAMVIRFIMTEVDIKSSHTTEEQSFECYSSADEEKTPIPEDVHPSCFVNDAAIAWHENRREWVGDQSQRSTKVPRDSIIRMVELSKDQAFVEKHTSRGFQSLTIILY